MCLSNSSIKYFFDVVYVFKYFVIDIVVSQSVVRNIEKCLFEAFANFNREITNDDEKVEHAKIDE